MGGTELALELKMTNRRQTPTVSHAPDLRSRNYLGAQRMAGSVKLHRGAVWRDEWHLWAGSDQESIAPRRAAKRRPYQTGKRIDR